MNKIKCFIYNIFFVIIIVLFGSLIINKNGKIKTTLYKNLYVNYISFAKIKDLYNKTIGPVIPFENIIKTKEVFNESLSYKELNTYDKGVKLTLDNNYSIPILNDGIVIFIGNKDNLNNTVIIEDKNKVDYYYGNLDKVNVKLYDYVSKNDLLGIAKDNTLYLLFYKDEKYLDYKEFLKKD